MFIFRDKSEINGMKIELCLIYKQIFTQLNEFCSYIPID